MADPTQQLQQMLNNAESSFGGLNSAGQQLASSLLQAAKAGNTQTNAATATSQSLAQLTARSASVDAGFKNIGGAFVGLINQATNLTADIYGADKAFTSVIPTVNAVSSVLSKVITGIGEMGSGISFLTFSFGNASRGLASFANTGIEIVTNILKFQLETSQKVAEGFIASSKAGALFGGSITRLGQSAASVFVPIQTLVKVITANAESLSKLGLGQERAGLLVAGMTKQVFNSSESLRVMYGGFDELAVGVAQYLELQSQLGINVKRDDAVNRASAIEYLYRQKELTAITGKNADLQKKEEQARRTQLDYNLKLGSLGNVAKENVQESLALFGEAAGPAGVKFLEEYFATGGKVISKAALTFQADMPQFAELGIGLIESVNQSRAGFRESAGALFKEAGPALLDFAKSQGETATINRAANNEILTVRGATLSAALAAASLFENLDATFVKIEANRAAMEKGPLDKPTKAFADAQKELLINQTEIDKTVLKNMESIGATLKLFNDIQRGFISLQAEANDTLNKIIKGGFSSPEYVKELISKILEVIQNPPARPPNTSTGSTGTPTGPTGTPTGPNNPPPPPPPSQPNTSGSGSQSAPTPAEQTTAALQLEIDRLNREVVAIRNAPPPVNEDQNVILTAIRTVLEDSSDKLTGIKDALA